MGIKRESDKNIDSLKYGSNEEERVYLNERNREKRKNSKFSIRLVGLLILIGVVVMVVLKIMKIDWTSALFHSTGDMVSEVIEGQEGTVTTISETSLEEVFEISELSTADYAYNAVAYAYENDGITPKYYVAYEGMVTAGIDFSKIIIDVDENKKSITLKIPNCEILDTTVGFGSMQYIFENNKYNTETVSQEAYELCEVDLAVRAEKEEDLLSLAKENATAAVEALVNPWVNQIESDYTVIIQ
jgi:predicted nucleic acid-binding Zn ribbon protein